MATYVTKGYFGKIRKNLNTSNTHFNKQNVINSSFGIYRGFLKPFPLTFLFEQWKYLEYISLLFNFIVNFYLNSILITFLKTIRITFLKKK